ncbi:MAG: AMP-binding enzyme, partial [Myxococcaceae bacterium]
MTGPDDPTTPSEEGPDADWGFPEEVEKALKSHPAVFDATVVGTPNERFGAQVTAVVELRRGHSASPPSLAELQDHCRQHLAG